MRPSALWVASLSGLLGALDTSVNIAFPAITEAFQLDVTMMQWVVVSYVLTYASLLVSCGRLADLLGHTRLLRLGLVLSAVALLGCGVAPSLRGCWLLGWDKGWLRLWCLGRLQRWSHCLFQLRNGVERWVSSR